jgi:hypothetical protein
MALMWKGKIDGKKKRAYQGRERVHLQFVNNTEDGELSFLEIRIPENMNGDVFEIGKEYEFPVTYSLVQGEVYFKIPDNFTMRDLKASKVA